MYNTARKLRKKVSVRPAYIKNLVRDYTSKTCLAMRRLYDLGYSNTPYHVDEYTIRESLLEEFEDTALLTDKSSGRIKFSTEFLDYAYMMSNDDDFKQSIKAYRDYLVCKNILETCDEFMKANPIIKSRLVSVPLYFSVTEGVSLRTKQPILMDFLYDREKYDTVSVNFADCIIKSAAIHAGMTLDEYATHKASGKPFFIKGLTQEQEESVACLIVEGSVELTTELGVALTDKILHYYTDFTESNVHSVVQLTFSTQVFVDSIPYINDKLAVERERIYAEGGEELFITSTSVIYQVEKKNSKFTLPKTITVGDYLVDDENAMLLTTDIFSGTQGIFSSEGTLPCYLTGFGWGYFVDDTSDFKHIEKKDIFEEYDSKDKDDLLAMIRKFTKSDLAAELVLAVLYARCEEYEYCFTMDVSGVTEVEYLASAQDAVNVLGYTFNVL